MGFDVQCMVCNTEMINDNEALEIAKKYAQKTGYGWDERFHEVEKTHLDGETVWMISTSDLKFSDELPWMMENMPNPVRYYINITDGTCVAVGSKGGNILRLNN